MKLFVAMPSSGKSFFAENVKNVVDTDNVLDVLYSDHGKDVWIKRGDTDAQMVKKLYKFSRLMGGNFATDFIVTNIHDLAERFPSEDVYYFVYGVRDYVPHVKSTDRSDLLENFGEDELNRWVSDYWNRILKRSCVRTDRIVEMAPGLFLSDYAKQLDFT